MYIQFVREVALENARNGSVSIVLTVQINQKKLYYNDYTFQLNF
jgi:hypothetical protein